MSSYVDATSASVQHCELMAQQFPDLAEPYYNKFVSLCQQKLWHQLTLLLLEFVGELPSTADNGGGGAALQTLRPLSDGEYPNTYVALYNKVVLTVANKVNQLSLCRVCSAVAFASWRSGGSTLDETKQILQDLLTKQESGTGQGGGPTSMSNNVATVLYLQSKLGLLTLLGASPETPLPKSELDKIYTSIKADAKLLTQLIPDTPDAMVVNSAHYERSMTYFKSVGPPEAFYEEAIHYLNYYSPPGEDAPAADKQKAHELAVDLCLAALTGEGVYNLGQVVTNPILQVLTSTSESWLVELLTTVSKGHVVEYKQLVNVTYRDQISKQPALVNIGVQMEEKVILLGLVELVFSKPATDRTLTFSEISTTLGIPLDQVEWVIMRAFSVKLMEGVMDQVDGGDVDGGTVHITWILPRSLTPEQMSDLASRFGEWALKVENTKTFMTEETAPALMA
jgi:26S proteasome regulatory subunit N9